MGLDYVDIFYSHRPDPNTPLEETMGALDQAVRSGKALYAGISSYTPEQTRDAARIMRGLGTPLLIHQPSYSLLNRWVEDASPNLLEVLDEEGMGCIAFSPLAQGMLTDHYLKASGDSRAAQHKSLFPQMLSEENLDRVRATNQLAENRGQSLAQMAIAWVLREQSKGSPVTSALIGASRSRSWRTASPPWPNSISRARKPRPSTSSRWTPTSTSGSRRASPWTVPPRQTRRPSNVRLTDAAALDFDQVLALYDAVGWTVYTSSPETVSAALSGSAAIAVAHAGTELVGLARVISDGASICYLQDVLVRPAFQRQGIGRRLVESVLQPFSHVRQKVLLTDDEAGQKAFYESLGYTQVTDNDGGALRAFARFDA